MSLSLSNLFFLIKCIVLTALLGIFFGSNTFATDYYQRQSGDWNNPDTWTTSSSWEATVNTGTYPQAGDNVHIANNGMLATITLTEDAECENLYFGGSEPACVIVFGNYNLTVNNTWTINWSSNATISQTSGYLQINGSISMFRTAKTVANFRVGSSSFSFTQTNTIVLTVSSSYDHNCFTASVPTGINVTGTEINSTPCTPELSSTVLDDFDDVCAGTEVGPYKFTISGLALTTDNVTVNSLNGFSYSTTANGTYLSSLSLSQSGGNYSQDIYVMFAPTSLEAYDGNITVGGGGSADIYVAATGRGANTVIPTVELSVAEFESATHAVLGGDVTIEGCTSNSITERGIYYSTTDGFADGEGTKVSKTGTFSTGEFSVNVFGLSENATYYFKAYATNSVGTGYSEQGTFSNVPKTYYSSQTGNWSSSSTWTTSGCGGTANSGTYPKSYDDVVICQSHTVTIDTSDLACNNLSMKEYAGHLILNNDFSINGDLALKNQSYISVDDNDLTINGDFSNKQGTPYNTRIEYSSGNIYIAGDINAVHSGMQPFYCTGYGWLILSGTSQVFNAYGNVKVLYLKQSYTSFTKEKGNKNIVVTGIFDQNCGPEPTINKGSFIVNGATINDNCTGLQMGYEFFPMSCAGANDASIEFTETATSYSIDGGSTYQSYPLFEDLAPGIYTLATMVSTTEYISSTEVEVKEVNEILLADSIIDDTCNTGVGSIDLDIVYPDTSSLYFDGVDDYIALHSHFEGQDDLPELTVSAWIKVESGEGGWAIIDFDRNCFFNLSIGDNEGADDYVHFDTYSYQSTTGVNVHDFSGTVSVRDGKWHYVTGVYDGLNKYIYVDGELDSQSDNPYNGKPIGRTITRYGIIGDGSEASSFNSGRNEKYFKGHIAQVEVWSKSMTVGEIQQRMFSNLNGSEDGLHEYWKLEEGTGDSISDVTENYTGRLFSANSSDLPVWDDFDPFEYEWEKEGDSSFDSISQDISQLDSGKYIITVINMNGCSKTDTFIVHSIDNNPFSIILQPDDQETCGGSSIVNFSIETSANTGLTYQWYEIATSGTTTELTDDSQYRGSTLDSLTIINPENGNRYFVKVSNDCGTVTYSDTATVATVDFEIKLWDVTLASDSTAENPVGDTFNCPDLIYPDFNPSNDNYDPGTSIIDIRVDGDILFLSDWQFDYSITGGTVDTVCITGDVSGAITPSEITPMVDASGNQYIYFRIKVDNIPGVQQQIIFSISDISAGACTITESLLKTHTLLEMPETGPINTD